MEKQRNNNGGKPPTTKKLPIDKVFGGKSLHFSEETCSNLIGGIIEKGISDNFTAPLSTSSFHIPSTLPFPVARHRSHGPHWTPAGQFVANSGGVVDDDDIDEENEATNYEPLADFAEPLKIKRKKGLDFSRWKEVMRNDIDSNIQEKENSKSTKETVEQQKIHEYVVRNVDKNSLGNELSMDIDNNNSSPLDLPESQLERSPYNQANMSFAEVSSTNIVSIGQKNPSSSFRPNSVGYEQGHMSIESQIDAENRVLLEKMSPEEIAEAQAEIRNRLNPELLNILKKRGIKKLEKKTTSGLTSDSVDVPSDKQADGIEGEEWPSVRETTSLPVTPTVVWSTWSKRVEAVRNLRFSLEGNVIEGDSSGITNTTDNVAERDFLRTEGDPAAAGYTVKEALSLARSVVPGQRTLAWHLIESILDKALHNICKSQIDCTARFGNEMNLVDWEAIWAYALGPEPELALSLRLAIDDNHQSVTLASAKVIRCILTCDLNEEFFSSTMKLARMDLYTAPIFRSRPDIKQGFFGGGFWKYSTKPSNIIPPDEEVVNDKNEGERTIQDDNVVAGQDVAAGLVRMELLPRLRYLLEIEPIAALEECIASILVAIARHSPTVANAIWKCERLVQTVVDRFNKKDMLELLGAKVKYVTLLRVLAQSSKDICTDFINKGFFQVMTWQLYRVTSIGEWVKSGSEKSKLASQLMVEQLRFWKVCIIYGHCISSFTSFFPALCPWLIPPTFDKLTETNLFNEFASITSEIYLVLETLANSLPEYSSDFRNQQFLGSCGNEAETWCWNDVSPMVDSALQWLKLRPDTTLRSFFDQLVRVDNKSLNRDTRPSSLLWILSAVMHFLHTILIKVTPRDMVELKGDGKNKKIIPGFVSKIVLRILKNGIFDFSDQNEDLSGMSSLADELIYFRHKSDPEASLAAVWCLNTLGCLIVSTDRLIHQSQDNVEYKHFEGKISHDGIFKSSLPTWEKMLSEFMDIILSNWQCMRRFEVFGRGGPAPGVGVGWGVSRGGFWSSTVVSFQEDARLLIELLGSWVSSTPLDLPDQDEKFMVQIIDSALASSLMVGPGDKMILQNIFGILLKVPVLKYLNQRILRFLHSYLGKESLKWEIKEDDLLQFSKILDSHFSNRWLDVKNKKKKPEVKNGSHLRNKSVNRVGNSLTSIPEDVETSDIVTREDRSSLMVEWSRQQMPLPSYWLLSPITTINNIISMEDPVEFLEVAKSGLFLLLGIEAMSSDLSEKDNSPIWSIPLIWKLHSLSVPLIVGKGVLEEENSRDMFEALQGLYGQYLDELQFSSIKDGDCLRFQTEIHENYSTFFEALVEQFAAVSYGDVIYGRQIAVYLHRQVESSVRLTSWNALSNARVLELLPPLEKCISRAEGYLEPAEDDDAILEAYVKSWVSGALDRAVTRGSVSYRIAVHHLSSFIFGCSGGEKSLLRSKLVKSLLRDYSRKRQHEAMMQDLIQCNSSTPMPKSKQTDSASSLAAFIAPRLELLREACEGNLQLLTEVDKLEASITIKQIGVIN